MRTTSRRVRSDHLERNQTMKRLHVHVAVDDLAANVRFYSSVSGADSKSEKAPIDADMPVESTACCAPRSKVIPVAAQPVKACC